MFKVNDVVNYSTTGACRIEEISSRLMDGAEKTFYLLKPIFEDNATLMVPVENELLVSRMRPVLTKAQVEKLVREIPSVEAKWIADDRLRFEEYKKTLVSPNRKDVVAVAKALFVHRENQSKKGRKLRSMDERFVREGERIICTEIAYSLNITLNEALQLVKEAFSK